LNYVGIEREIIDCRLEEATPIPVHMLPPTTLSYVMWWKALLHDVYIGITTACHIGYAHVTHSRNQRHKSTPCFWYMCHANLRPDSSGTRFRRRLEHCSIPGQKVACAWLKWWLVIGRW